MDSSGWTWKVFAVVAFDAASNFKQFSVLQYWNSDWVVVGVFDVEMFLRVRVVEEFLRVRVRVTTTVFLKGSVDLGLRVFGWSSSSFC